MLIAPPAATSRAIQASVVCCATVTPIATPTEVSLPCVSPLALVIAFAFCVALTVTAPLTLTAVPGSRNACVVTVWMTTATAGATAVSPFAPVFAISVVQCSCTSVMLPSTTDVPG